MRYLLACSPYSLKCKPDKIESCLSQFASCFIRAHDGLWFFKCDPAHFCPKYQFALPESAFYEYFESLTEDTAQIFISEIPDNCFYQFDDDIVDFLKCD
ncbi:hypothetical protein [Eubacterium limosum]|uniref:hypothetical protein n=1 Tax=Eubacterium limosum TaxID=1736 RepID=UPI001062A55D|nr:hypothetical protein [Eubacterium limosum]